MSPRGRSGAVGDQGADGGLRLEDAGALAITSDGAIDPSGLRPNQGCGTVQRYEDDRVVVLFEQQGYKTLELETVLERELLIPAGPQPAADSA